MSTQDDEQKKSEIAYVCRHFATNKPVTEDSITTIERIETTMIKHLTILVSSEEAYYYIEDPDRFTSPEQLKGAIESVATIKTVRGQACLVKDESQLPEPVGEVEFLPNELSIEGVDMDIDGDFINHYLWHIGSAEEVLAK